MWEHIRDSEVENAVLSGRYAFAPKTRVNVINPDGELVNISSEDSVVALNNGYKWASAERVASDIIQDIARQRDIGIFDNKWLYILFGFFISYIAAVKWVCWLTQ